MAIDPIISNASAATRHYISARSVIIGGVTEDGQYFHTGSGTCVSIGKRFFIATAAHVVMSQSNGNIFVVNGKEAHAINCNVVIGMGYRGGKEQDIVDIAWLEVDATQLPLKSFINVTQLKPDTVHVPDDWLLIHGYPQEWQTKEGEGELAADSITHSTTTIESDELAYYL